MTLTDWRNNLEILGPDLTTWPPSLVPAALDLLEASEAARDLFVQATACALADEDRSHGSPSYQALAPARPELL